MAGTRRSFFGRKTTGAQLSIFFGLFERLQLISADNRSIEGKRILLRTSARADCRCQPNNATLRRSVIVPGAFID